MIRYSIESVDELPTHEDYTPLAEFEVGRLKHVVVMLVEVQIM